MRQAPLLAKPRVYFAGKISKNDFRHDLAPGLRGHEWAGGPLECDGFDYAGPFFRGCDHGCSHSPGTHGVAGYGCDGEEVTRREVFARNQAGVAAADLVLAFIEATDCHGTLVEIGWASRAGIPVHLVFAPGVEHSQLWYAQMAAGQPVITIAAREDLPALLGRLIANWRCGR